MIMLTESLGWLLLMSVRAARTPSLQAYRGASRQVPGHQQNREQFGLTWYHKL